MDNRPQPPYETPYIPYVPPTPPKKERVGLKRMGMLLLIFIALSGIGVSAYAMVRNASLKDELASEKSNSQTLQNENKRLKDTSGTSKTTITETLPNGKTMSYPDSEGNRNIIWWSANPDSEDNKGVITLSHKGYQKFLSTLDSDLIAGVCSPDGEPAMPSYNISAGTFDTASKTLIPSEDTNCVAALSSTDNADEASRDAAQKVIDKVSDDISQFVDSVTIE